MEPVEILRRGASPPSTRWGLRILLANCSKWSGAVRPWQSSWTDPGRRRMKAANISETFKFFKLSVIVICVDCAPCGSRTWQLASGRIAKPLPTTKLRFRHSICCLWRMWRSLASQLDRSDHFLEHARRYFSGYSRYIAQLTVLCTCKQCMYM